MTIVRLLSITVPAIRARERAVCAFLPMMNICATAVLDTAVPTAASQIAICAEQNSVTLRVASASGMEPRATSARANQAGQVSLVNSCK